MATTKNGATERFPKFKELVDTIKRNANHIISCKTVPGAADGSGPMFHAHAYIDRREYLISIVPTDLDGPDAR